MFIPVNEPVLSGNEKKYLNECIETGWISSEGPFVKRFEEEFASRMGRKHGIAVCNGSAAIDTAVRALGIGPGDEVIIPTFTIISCAASVVRAGAVPVVVDCDPYTWNMDVSMIEKKITPKTKLLVLNDLQNPTGAECSVAEFEKLAEIVNKHNLFVLCDEAYFDIRYEGKSSSFASLPGMAERSVILYTFSKKFAMTGWRLGAAIGPKDIIDVIAKLNVNDESCPNHFIQYGAIEGLTGDQTEARQILGTLKKRRDAAVSILNSIEGVRCFCPNATFYLFPNVTGAMQKKGLADYDKFRRTVLQETGVSFCTRLHFGRPLAGEDNFYIRLAYSGIDTAEIKEGLGKFKAFIES